MNRKQLFSLLACGLVVGAAYWFVSKQDRTTREVSVQKMGQKLLPDFPVNDVAQLTFKQRGAEVNLVKKDDVWVVKERGEYPANFSTLRDLLIKMSDLKIANPVRVGQSRLGALELLAPEQCASTLVEFKDAKGKAIKSLLLGAKHTKEAPANSPYGGGAWPDGRYVMVNNDIQTVALVNDALQNTEPKAEDWLNKDWFKVEKLRSIAITATNATNNWKLSRESETNDWKLADVKAGEQLDNAKISDVTSALSSPSFNDVVTNASPDQTKGLVAKLETVDGFTYDIKVANKSGDDYYLQMAVSAAYPKERTPGKDEKPEDKTKLDKEFADKKAKLDEKLKSEKAFEKWTYVVSKWSIQPLLKERKELLQEKKEESKAAEAKPAMDPLNIDPLKPVEAKPAAAPSAKKAETSTAPSPEPPTPPEPPGKADAGAKK